MVVIGVVIFAVASALCGLAPSRTLGWGAGPGVGAAWLIVFRVIAGVGGALLFPAAQAVV